MIISDNSTVLLHFKSYRSGGELFEDTTKGEPQRVTFGQKMINPAFEEALIGKSEGDTVEVILPPEKAYGKYNKHLVIPVKRSKLKLDKEPVEGALIPLEVKGKQYFVTVLEVKPSKIVIDANHPLAGETMRYEISVVKILDGV
ncbi:MAG TPA: FKBP-type peptidyl-prolyl cis-trans isomerase [Methanocorpusculum sp.]|nr:FKBP-type peptidyl-prolyl cis-trans isomerase [Methanocorpusculum sp.]